MRRVISAIGVRTAAVVATSLLVTLTGCGGDDGSDSTDDAPPVGTSEQTLRIDGEDRTYLLHRPADLDERAPLVVMLHGGGENARQAQASYGWDALADREGFLVAYPEAVDRNWNAAEDGPVDDVAFLTGVVEDVATLLQVDRHRVFVAGMSRGAMMAYTLACRTDVAAAIAPVAGTMLAECDEASPVSVLHVHGTADTAVPLQGGSGGRAAVDGPPLTEVIEHWRVMADCAPATVSTAGPVQRSVSTCSEGRAVEFWTIAASGHRWPAADDASSNPAAVDATSAIWQFFVANPGP